MLTGSLAEDVVAAVAEIKRQTNCEDVLLFGLCSGANTAVYAGDRISDVCGLVLVNLPVAVDSSKRRQAHQGGMNLFQEQFMFEAYVRKLLSPRAWGRMFSGQSDFKSILYLMKKKLLGSQAAPKATSADTTSTAPTVSADDGFGFNFDMLRTFESFWKSGRPIYLFFSENDPIRVNFETYFEQRHGLELMTRYSDLCHKIVFKNANHSFVNSEWREQLFERVAQCGSKETAWPTQARR